MKTSQRWADVAREVHQLTDKLGSPVDAGIFDAVVALRLCGINTTGSCAGHLDRRICPYVAFRAPQTAALELKAREIGDPHSLEYQDLRRQAAKLNVLEVGKLFPYLDRFYEHRSTPHTQRLVIKFFGPTTSLLLCQNAELIRAVDDVAAVGLLRQSQNEMQAFTDFLTSSRDKKPSPARTGRELASRR